MNIHREYRCKAGKKNTSKSNSTALESSYLKTKGGLTPACKGGSTQAANQCAAPH